MRCLRIYILEKVRCIDNSGIKSLRLKLATRDQHNRHNHCLWKENHHKLNKF